MKYINLIAFFLLFSFVGFTQNQSRFSEKQRKGELYFYWGWNLGWYSKSNIKFKGEDYDFVLKKVVAKDRQSPLNADTYLNPNNMTIPQFSFRVGYFINNKYNISFGVDHMKYVVQENQFVKISGTIDKTGTIYDRQYDKEDILIDNDFLRYEHTDGLNYINIGCRRFDALYTRKNLSLNLITGIETGILFPKTNTALWNREGYDDFNLSGYGLNAITGLNIELYKFFFIQSEFKAGFMDLPDVKTSYKKIEGASQNFFFAQLNIVFGASINLKKKKTVIKPKQFEIE